jgi:hypothetical protein
MRQSCDICRRSDEGFFALTSDGFVELVPLVIDEDGLRICGNCRAQMVTTLEHPLVSETVAEALRPLAGKPAGVICTTLNLPYRPPFRSVVDAASQMQDSLMSTWSFVTQWNDATTVWRAADGRATAVVAPDGTVRIQES